MPKELRRAPGSLSVWKSNIRELKIGQPKLAGMLEAYVKEHGHDFEHYENITPAGKWVEGLAGEPFFERGEEPKFNWSRDRREDRDKPVFILYGVGTPPYLFRAIKALPEGAMALIAAEPNISLIAYTLHMTHAYSALPKGCRMAFLAEGLEEGKTEQDKRDSKFLNDQLLREECLGYTLRHVSLYAAALSEVSAHDGEADVWKGDFSRFGRGIREWVNVMLTYLGNSTEDTLLGFRQMALMAPQIAFGTHLEPLRKKYEGRPAVLVSAGPSLDKNFMLLKDIQDKCVIIAADAILKKLLENGIKPHIVTSLERVMVTYDLYYAEPVERFHNECEDILLVAQSLCVPWISGRWPGPFSLVSKQDVMMDEWFTSGVLGGTSVISGISVAHLNYSLAHYLGASHIAIIGQDLAFGDDGSTHAGSVNGTRKGGDRSGAMEIPGSLGGKVRTLEIWVSFLRFLESLILGSPTPTWDCTEGGALIAGTLIRPFADFIAEKVSSLKPLGASPADIIRNNARADVAGVKKQVLRKMRGLYPQLDFLEKKAEEAEGLMLSTTEAGLERKRRVELASKVGQKLDEMHKSSPVFDFIAQSYTRLAAMEIILTRSLDSAETIKRWYSAHKEITDSHRAVLRFLREWIAYAEKSIEYWGTKGRVEFGPLPKDEAFERASKLFEELAEAEGERIVALRLEITDVMMRCDPIRLEMPGYILWNYALLLMKEGRSALATRFMDAAANYFDGKEMAVDDMYAFFKDYARVLMGYDLTHRPNLFKAEEMLSNAVGLRGADDEVREILDELLNSEVAREAIVDEFYGRPKAAAQTEWFRDRAGAMKQLHEGDLKQALVSVWKAISKHWMVVPGWAASHLEWLTKTMEKCLGTDDPLLAEAVDGLLYEMAANLDVLRGVPSGYTPRFVKELMDHGLEAETPAMLIKEESGITEVSS
jgi:hypothetical protein